MKYQSIHVFYLNYCQSGYSFDSMRSQEKGDNIGASDLKTAIISMRKFDNTVSSFYNSWKCLVKLVRIKSVLAGI